MSGCRGGQRGGLTPPAMTDWRNRLFEVSGPGEERRGGFAGEPAEMLRNQLKYVAEFGVFLKASLLEPL